MADPLRDTLLRQFDTAWALASFHLDALTTDDCLWRPAERGPHVRPTSDGAWVADWPVEEAYSEGPPSIAWISWHMLMWWSLAIDRHCGSGGLDRDDVSWPGDAQGVRLHLQRLRDQWREWLTGLTDADLLGTSACWPFQDRVLADLFAWANVELTKNTAEIGYALFLKGACEDQMSCVSRP